MTAPRTIRLEFHSEGQSTLLERTSDPVAAQDILARHLETLIANASVGRLILFDEFSGNVLARKTLKGGTRTGSQRAIAS